MKILELIETTQYKKLEAHVKKTLNNVNFVFGQNNAEFILFLGCLLVDANYKAILNVDKRILLLLRDTDKFWLDNELVKEKIDDPFKELIQALLKLNALRYLKIFVDNYKHKKNSNVITFEETNDPLKELKQTLVKLSVLSYLKMFVNNSKYKQNSNVITFVEKQH